MLRLIFTVLIVVLVVVAARRLVASLQRPREQTPARLVRCGYCGVYITRDTALPAGEDYYCSAEHRDKSRET